MAVVVLVEEKNKRRDLKDFELIKARSEGFKEHLIQIWGFRIRYVALDKKLGILEMTAENALAIIQERGFSNLRRSRHRLTPGTVKFAAFHVLSLKGSNGLTILGVAEKIQKSGLRDLTTSKTPEGISSRSWC